MRIDIYRDKKKEWRWRLVALNGRILADGAEGYKRFSAMMRILRKIAANPWPVLPEENKPK